MIVIDVKPAGSVTYRLSVVIATWNRKELASQAIDSVLGQQFDGPLEIIVVDDESTDGLLEDLAPRYARQSLPANRRLLMYAKPHSGISGTMSQGYQLASTDYIAMCNSDDLWEPHRAEELLEEFARTPDMLLHTNMKRRYIAGYSDPGYPETDDLYGASGVITAEYPGNLTLPMLMFGWPKARPVFVGGSVAFPRKLLQGEFVMPAGLWTEETWLLFAAVLQGGVRYVNRPSYVFRIHGRNDSLPGAQPPRRVQRMRCRLVLLEHALPILKARSGKDPELLRRVAARIRTLRCRLALIDGADRRTALGHLAPSDLFVEPREVLALTLKAQTPSVHRLLTRARQTPR